MKNKLTATLSIKQQLLCIMEEITDILKTMDHPEYNVLMRDTASFLPPLEKEMYYFVSLIY
jgi:hypothetical protein